MEESITLNIPESFQQACQDYKVEPQDAIQCFVDHIKVSSHFAVKGRDPYSLANIIISQCFDDKRMLPMAKNDPRRQICIKHSIEMFRLVRANIAPAAKRKAGNQLINKWYEELKQSD
jgi:hypothetical protein